MLTIGDDTRNVLDIELGPQQSVVIHINKELHEIIHDNETEDGVDLLVAPRMVRANGYSEVNLTGTIFDSEADDQ